MSQLAAEFLAQNNWANQLFIEFCEAIPEEMLEATVPGTYGKVRDTLVHMVGSLGRYHFALTGRFVDPDSPVDSQKPWPGFEFLKRTVLAAGEALLKLTAEAPEGWEVRNHYENQYLDWRMAGSVALVQAVNHCADHRSQIATILSQAGLEPPQVDGWAWGYATDRLKEA